MPCATCGKTLDNPDDSLSEDCGGDCVLCMAEAGDPDCIRAVSDARQHKTPTLDTEAERIRDVLDTRAHPEFSSDAAQRGMSHYD